MTWLFSKALLESLPCLQERAGGSSGESCSDGEPYVQLSVMPTQQQFWRNDKMTDCSIFSRFGLTYQVLTESRGEAVLMSFLAGFPAKTFQQPEAAQESTESGQGYGVNLHESLAKYDPDACSWKTPQLSLLGGSDEFSETWPRWGSVRDGVAWLRPTAVPLTDDKESGLWPTPTVSGNHNRKGASATSGDGLATAVKKWPTPCARDWKDTPGMAMQATNPDGSRRDRTDRLAARVYVQTENPSGGTLNPAWVEWLMGWPIGWTDLKPLETARFQLWLQQHGECSEGSEAA